MPKLKIDGREVEVADGATVLDAARTLGIEIHSLCHRKGFDASTSCMVCVVRIDGAKNFVPSCATRAAEGMEVESETDEVHAARRNSLELLLSDHAGDCVAPCQLAAPSHAHIPRFLRRVGEGDLDGAAAVLTSAGLRFDRPDEIDLVAAEKACRRARHDQTVAISRVARHVAETRRDPPAASTDSPPPWRKYSVRLGKLSPEERNQLLAGTSPPPDTLPEDPEERARAEAGLCLHCDCRQANDCRLRDAAEAYGAKANRFRVRRPPFEQDRSHPHLIHEPGKCIRCGLCLQVARRAGERLGLAFVGRGHSMNVRVPFGDPLSQALSSSARECAEVCPSGALVWIGTAGDRS
jgi:ferredoxin